MTPLAFIYFFFVAIFLILVLFFTNRKKRSQKIKTGSETAQKNNLFLLSILKEIQTSITSAGDIEKIVALIVSGLEKNYPYSVLSSGFVKNGKLMFKSTIKESVSHAFVDSIKNKMLQFTNTTTAEETLEGTPVNELITTTINSAADIKLVIDTQVVAIIDLSSTANNLYSEADFKTFSSISELVSILLTKINSLLFTEKSKSTALIDSFSEGVFLIDKDNALIAMNKSATDILSIYKEAPSINDVLSALPNTYNFKDKINKVMIEKKVLQENEVQIKDKVFNLIISPVIDTKNNNLLGASILLHDVTLEKSLSQMKKDFTNVMVHELRSPLTAIKASSEFLTSKADLTDFEKNKLTQMISESSRKMLDVIALILDSAKMDAGLFTIRKTESDIKKLITDRINVFTPLAKEKSINLLVSIEQDLPKFAFDPIRIDEVLNNLLSNSLKFTPNNGTIQINAAHVLNKIVVSVKDSGSGIPKDKQHLLFAKFQQAPTDGDHQGTGLGLYVVKGVVEAHGGTVSLESEVGAGTKISFALPISDKEGIIKLEEHKKEPATTNPSNPMVN